jgi:hypothetical protein
MDSLQQAEMGQRLSRVHVAKQEAYCSASNKLRSQRQSGLLTVQAAPDRD